MISATCATRSGESAAEWRRTAGRHLRSRADGCRPARSARDPTPGGSRARCVRCNPGWIAARGVPPTNNEAERALRHAVILRKLSFGTQSDRGSRFIERMLSAVDTLRKQDRDVMDFLMDALDAKATTATPPSLLPTAA